MTKKSKKYIVPTDKPGVKSGAWSSRFDWYDDEDTALSISNLYNKIWPTFPDSRDAVICLFCEILRTAGVSLRLFAELTGRKAAAVYDKTAGRHRIDPVEVTEAALIAERFSTLFSPCRMRRNGETLKMRLNKDVTPPERYRNLEKEYILSGKWHTPEANKELFSAILAGVPVDASFFGLLMGYRPARVYQWKTGLVPMPDGCFELAREIRRRVLMAFRPLRSGKPDSPWLCDWSKDREAWDFVG